MILSGIQREERPPFCQLSGRVTAAGRGAEGGEVWFRLPLEFAGFAAAGGDAFLPALLLPAMLAGEDLRIEAPVSGQLLSSIVRIQDILRLWMPGARRIRVEAPAGEAAGGENAAREATFFSGGVDSFHTLLTNRERITHLLLVHGFDIPLESEALFAQARAGVERVGRHFGKTPIPVATNLRLLFPRIDWEMYHGSAMAAVGLALGRGFGTVRIPSSFPYGRLQPWGSSPFLDPLWSTESTRFLHDGANVGRTAKVLSTVSRCDLALETLRVCWENRGGRLNCGTCEKCVRTMLMLHAAGVLDRCTVFSRPLSLRQVLRLRYTLLSNVGMMEEAYAALPDRTRRDRALRRALRFSIAVSRLRLAARVARGRPI